MLSKMTSQKYGFFDLFTRHATSALEASRCLLEVFKAFPGRKEALKQIEAVEHECDSIAHMTIDLLHRTFITPLDRDEILNLVKTMDDIVDAVDDASRKIVLFAVEANPPRLVELVQVLHRAQEEVVKATKLLEKKVNTDELQSVMKEIHRLENEGDRLYHAGLVDLFREHAKDPLTVIKLKEIFEAIEFAIDRCEDVSNVVEGIVLEHS